MQGTRTWRRPRRWLSSRRMLAAADGTAAAVLRVGLCRAATRADHRGCRAGPAGAGCPAQAINSCRPTNFGRAACAATGSAFVNTKLDKYLFGLATSHNPGGLRAARLRAGSSGQRAWRRRRRNDEAAENGGRASGKATSGRAGAGKSWRKGGAHGCRQHDRELAALAGFPAEFPCGARLVRFLVARAEGSTSVGAPMGSCPLGVITKAS